MADWKEFLTSGSRKELLAKYGTEEHWPYNSSIVCVCFFCSQEFSTRLDCLKKRLKSKFFPEELSCSAACNRIKQDKINKYRTAIGDSPATGHILPKKTRKLIAKKNRDNGNYDRLARKRKGKTYVQLFGPERAEQISKKCGRGIANFFQKTGKYIHEGHAHSSASREKMSASALAWQKKHSHKKTYRSPLTGEVVTRSELVTQKTLLFYKNNPKAREKRRKQAAERYGSRKPRRMRSNTGILRQWCNHTKQFYESSLEKNYMLHLNRRKKHWKKNSQIVIPYIHPEDHQRHFYCPDFVIFSRKDHKKMVAVVETKPHEFVFNPKQRDTLYYRITQEKIASLKNFCLRNNLKCLIVTEQDLPEFYVKSRSSEKYYPKKTSSRS
jgi:hypothetical protein